MKRIGGSFRNIYTKICHHSSLYRSPKLKKPKIGFSSCTDKCAIVQVVAHFFTHFFFQGKSGKICGPSQHNFIQPLDG